MIQITQMTQMTQMTRAMKMIQVDQMSQVVQLMQITKVTHMTQMTQMAQAISVELFCIPIPVLLPSHYVFNSVGIAFEVLLFHLESCGVASIIVKF